jgi:hypothetical protein
MLKGIFSATVINDKDYLKYLFSGVESKVRSEWVPDPQYNHKIVFKGIGTIKKNPF